MYVTVYGSKVEVEVSDNGTFFDKATKQHSARTLTGLQNKMLVAFKPQGCAEVEHKTINKQGKAVNVNNSKYEWNRTYSVKWDDGTQTIENVSSLRRRTTDAEKKYLDDLHKAYEAADQAKTNAYQVYSTYATSLEAASMLKEAFRKG